MGLTKRSCKKKEKNCKVKYYDQRFLTALNFCYYKRKCYIVWRKRNFEK